MSETIKIKLAKPTPEKRVYALRMAEEFNKKEPEKMGFNDGSIYSISDFSAYIYRTKTATVVRENAVFES